MIFISEDSLWEVVLKIEGRITFPLRGRLKIICPSSTFFPGFSPTLPRNERTLGTRSASLFPFPAFLSLIAFSFAITNWSWNLLKTNSQTVWKHGDVLKNWDFFRFLHRHAHFQWQPPVNCLNAVSCFSAKLIPLSLCLQRWQESLGQPKVSFERCAVTSLFLLYT